MRKLQKIMSSYEIRETKHYQRIYKKLVKKDRSLAKKIENTIIKLSENPFEKSLKSHQANTQLFGKKWSSKITGNLRLIWDFIEGKTVILALTLGGHEGKDKIYK